MKRVGKLKVKIREDLVAGDCHGDFTKDMEKYRSKEAIVIRINHADDYELDIDEGENEWYNCMFEDVQITENTTDCQNPNDILESLARKITPQSLESNDGRFSIKVSDAEFLELTMTMLKADEDGYMQEDTDNVQKLEFHVSDLDRLIEIFQAAKQIETRCWDTIKEQFK